MGTYTKYKKALSKDDKKEVKRLSRRKYNLRTNVCVWNKKLMEAKDNNRRKVCEEKIKLYDDESKLYNEKLKGWL